jgi:hypothetical protein
MTVSVPRADVPLVLLALRRAIAAWREDEALEARVFPDARSRAEDITRIHRVIEAMEQEYVQG